MVCWLESNNPLLRIQPQRVERISINPEILILRSIVLEKDMEYLKEIALTKVFHLHSYFNF